MSDSFGDPSTQRLVIVIGAALIAALFGMGVVQLAEVRERFLYRGVAVLPRPSTTVA